MNAPSHPISTRGYHAIPTFVAKTYPSPVRPCRHCHPRASLKTQTGGRVLLFVEDAGSGQWTSPGLFLRVKTLTYFTSFFSSEVSNTVSAALVLCSRLRPCGINFSASVQLKQKQKRKRDRQQLCECACQCRQHPPKHAHTHTHTKGPRR